MTPSKGNSLVFVSFEEILRSKLEPSAIVLMNEEKCVVDCILPTGDIVLTTINRAANYTIVVRINQVDVLTDDSIGDC